MIRPSLPENEGILHTFDLGQHLLLLMHDGGMELMTMTEQAMSSVDTVMQLTSEETYRLYSSLHEQFQHLEREQIVDTTYSPDDLRNSSCTIHTKTGPRGRDESQRRGTTCTY